MKRIWTQIYAWAMLALFLGGAILVAVLAWGDVDDLIDAVCGIFLSVLLAPTLHELGHVAFGRANGLKTVYCKCFFFRYVRKEGKAKLQFANPFEADETQVLPTKSGDMKKRFSAYALGGLVFGGAYLLVVLGGAITLTAIGHTNFLLWGTVPYAAYLLLLNAAPLEYPSGKTDALVYIGLQKGYDAERVTLAVLEAQALLYEGKSFAEMERELLFSLPQLPENEPVLAILLELKYRYFLEREDYAGAHDALSRWVDIQAYLPVQSYNALAIELAYFDLLHGSTAGLDDAKEVLGEGLDGTPAALRTLALYAFSQEDFEGMKECAASAREALRKETLSGVRRFEEILLSRMENAETAQGK